MIQLAPVSVSDKGDLRPGFLDEGVGKLMFYR